MKILPNFVAFLENTNFNKIDNPVKKHLNCLFRPWELNKHRKVRGMRRAKVPQMTYSQVYCFYKVLKQHTDGPTIGFDYE